MVLFDKIIELDCQLEDFQCFSIKGWVMGWVIMFHYFLTNSIKYPAVFTGEQYFMSLDVQADWTHRPIKNKCLVLKVYIDF